MRQFTNDEIQLLTTMYQEGATYADIGRRLDRARATVGDKARQLGLKRDKPKKICPICNNEFELDIINAERQAYCSNNCRHKSYKKNNPTPPKIKGCINCNKSFESVKGRTTCSDECRKQYNRRQYNKKRRIRLYKCKCNHCEQIRYFKYKRNYCSERCSDRAYSKKKSIRARRFKRCSYCNKWHYQRGLHCSNECKKRTSRLKNTLRKSTRTERARQNGQYDADIDIYRLIERDGEQCYLCGDTVSFDCHYNDLKYPTIEHVLAIKNGGTHSWDNTKVACRDCNNKKGIKII